MYHIIHRMLQLLVRVLSAGTSITRFLQKILITSVLPLRFLWKRFCFPVIVRIYTMSIVLNERWKLFSHSSHRILSLVTHRIMLAVGVSIISGSIISINIVLAAQPEKGARQFASGAMIDRVVFQNTDVIITGEQLQKPAAQWLQDGGTIQTQLSPSVEEENTSPVMIAEITGVALAAPTAITKTARTRTGIEEYVVQNGDTASTIAAQFQLRMQTILDANNIDDPDMIKPGQTLIILPIDGIKYTFKKKDTLKKLAKIYKADIQDILDFNRLESEDDITVGQVLILPDGRIPPPPPPPPVVEQPVVAPVTQVATAITTTEPTAPVPVEEPVETEFVVPEEPTETAPTEASPASGSLVWPTTTTRISQGYGYGHTGLDIDGEFGDPIYSADNGTVVSAGWAGPYGNMVVVDHGNGIVTRYAHLQAIYVSPGQAVRQGATLGEEGSTGNSFGSHLHYEVMVNGQFVNPYSY